MWYHRDMSMPDERSKRGANRPAPKGRKSGSARRVTGKSAAFTIGLADFAKISAVEGLHLSAEMKRMFREFDRQNLSAEERRRRIIAKYGKQRAIG
jgi:hypothetical protein